jgi:RNA polymerase primary sigma factor
MKQLKITQQITNRESASLEKYFQEISREEMITADQEVELAQRIKAGDKVALEKLTKANLRFVVSVAKQYQNGSMTLGDLINEGNLGLIKAAERFDETRGFKFISYAVWWIRQSIIQALAEHSRIVRLPLNRVSSLNKISKTFSELEQKYEREPTDEELASVMDITEEEVKKNRMASNKKVSVDAPFINGDGGCLLDIMEDDQEAPTDSSLVQDSLQKEVQRALSVLSTRESEVIASFYGLYNQAPMSLEEISYQYGLTRERVRQIKEKATKKLRHSPACRMLKTYL